VTSQSNFGSRPVALRGSVLRDKEPMEAFATVVGDFSQADNPAGPARELQVDVLAGLATPPSTMLVHMQLEALLMPLGSNAATVDPKSAVVDAESTTTLLSNPVRIDFVAPEDP